MEGWRHCRFFARHRIAGAGMDALRYVGSGLRSRRRGARVNSCWWRAGECACHIDTRVRRHQRCGSTKFSAFLYLAAGAKLVPTVVLFSAVQPIHRGSMSSGARSFFSAWRLRTRSVRFPYACKGGTWDVLRVPPAALGGSNCGTAYGVVGPVPPSGDLLRHSPSSAPHTLRGCVESCGLG